MSADFSALQKDMRTCRRCLEAGYAVAPGAIFSGPISARVMIVGQAPGITEVEARRPFNAAAGQRLFQWLAEAGWSEEAFRASQYVTSVTKCYPGKQPGAHARGDRAPGAAEQKLCAPFLERELALVDPELVIPVGGLAIERLVGTGRLTEIIGLVFQRQGRWFVPLPHPSGASLWLNRPEHRALLRRALGHLSALKKQLNL
ncbi:MAG: uracil-DNA glycosylase family protein [Chloroflexota bacterium]